MTQEVLISLISNLAKLMDVFYTFGSIANKKLDRKIHGSFLEHKLLWGICLTGHNDTVYNC